MTKRNPPAPAEQCTRKALQEITPGLPQLQHCCPGGWAGTGPRTPRPCWASLQWLLCLTAGWGSRSQPPARRATGVCQQGCPGVIEPEGHALGIVLTPCPANCPAGGRSVLLIEQGIIECAPPCKIILCLMTLQK